MLAFSLASVTIYFVSHSSKSCVLWVSYIPISAKGNTLQKLVLRVFNIRKCKEIYIPDGNPVYIDLQICAGGKEGKDSCGGDSGAGLVAKVKRGKKKGVFNLIGDVSWGPEKCGTAGKPGVYIKIRAYLDWILDSICEYKNSY